ncbi:MAG: ferrous iron transport protein B [Chthonomonadaceae bacterium]|nr:ferrous iron transport protein B [Chthonomonadaceae bacterium]
MAIVGNPNAGKTSLFNGLTGSFQKVGNYPGVTVEKVVGSLRLGDRSVECIDVPGLYSLEPVSQDEEVAVAVLKGLSPGTPAPDLLLCVLDAGNLERNLFFFGQLAEAGYPMVVALTMTDILARRGQAIDTAKLANLLGVEVVPVISHKGIGLVELREAIERGLDTPRRANVEFEYPIGIETKVAALCERLARAGMDAPKAAVRKALLAPQPESDEEGYPLELRSAFAEAREELEAEGLLPPKIESSSRYGWAQMVQRAVVTQSSPARPSTSHRLDWFLTHRVFGLAAFACIMCVVFLSIYTLAAPLMDVMTAAFDQLAAWIRPPLEGAPVVQSLLADGLIGGVGTMLTFLPQICILFFFIAALEGTGYLARAAFLMDRLLGWCGLNGRAFIPLLSSFACAIPGIMSARVMPDPKSRLATILVAPLMSCSARLPIYLLLIGAFIEPQFGPIWAGIALFGMHLVGLVVAIPVVFVLNRGVLRGKRLPFLLELPPYQWPKWRDVWLSVYFRGKAFVQTAGTIIVVLSVVIWALSYFPRSETDLKAYEARLTAEHPEATRQGIQHSVDEYALAHSFLGRFGKTIEPVFEPAGFDWRISTAILAAFPAREVVVASLGILFNLGGDVDEASGDLRSALQSARWPDGRPLVTPWTAVGLMVFFALCCQCMATLATVKRETNSWKWAAFMFTYMTVLAYLSAVGIHQLGRLF